VKVAGLLCALVLAPALVACGSQSATAGGFNPEPVFPTGKISDRVSHQIPALGHVASALAGKHATVNCWSNKAWAQLQAWDGSHHYTRLVDAAGITYPKNRRIELAPVVCEILAQVLNRSAQQPLFTAWAVNVLAHESAHASGIEVENRAECRAITTDPRTAELLGIPKALGRRLQHIFRGTIYPSDLPRYRLPPCAAGRPGVVVPDTLGTAANVRPLARVGTEFARSLSHWKSLGGVLSVGPLSPCSPIRSRTEELARFSEGYLGPGANVLFSDTTLKTKRDFSTALSRFKTHPRCSLEQFQMHLREIHSRSRASLQALPAEITRLSPRISGFRIRVSKGPIRVNNDLITMLDPAKRTFASVYFQAHVPVVSYPDVTPLPLPVAVEVAAVKAVLHSS
jgi:hypothetical protein